MYVYWIVAKTTKDIPMIDGSHYDGMRCDRISAIAFVLTGENIAIVIPNGINIIEYLLLKGDN